MNDSDRSQSEWGVAYRERWRLYDAFSGRIRGLLSELLQAEGITPAQIDARTKDVEGFIEKIGRRPGKYQNPLVDITDLSGVRVVLYYSSDVERVDSLIEREFTVDHENSWKRTPTSNPDRFGYRSDHYVVSCSSSRAGLGEWSPYAGLKAEIQVRTVLQHAWAAIDHRLNYKRASEIPAELKRQLFRISALLEVADDQFESVRRGAERLSSSYKERVSSGHLNLPIDRDSIEVYIQSSPRIEQWSEAAVRAGFEMEGPDWDSDPDDSEGVAELTLASQLAGFVDLYDLDQFLEQANDWGERALDALRPAGLGTSWYMTPAYILSSLICIGSELSREDLEATSGQGFYLDGILAARAAIAQ